MSRLRGGVATADGAKITMDRVRTLAKALPCTDVDTSCGTPALCVGKRLHDAENALVLRVDEESV